MDLLLWLHFSTIVPIILSVTAIIILLVLVYLRFFYVDYPKIEGIPEIPDGEVLAGHLYKLGDDHATTMETWALAYNWPIFQIRMGFRRAIILNSFETARDWMVKNQSSTLDRPWFYTFHGVVAATSAATIGTNPWDERTKKQRRVVGSLTTGPSIQKLRDMLDMETCAMISGLFYDGQKGKTDIMPHIYQKRLSLNVMMMFCYGTRFSSNANPLLLQILSDATTIASAYDGSFRSSRSNAQDFIPHLRYTSKSGRTTTAVEVRERRDKWLAAMLDKVCGTLSLPVGPRKSVAQMLLTDSQEGLTKFDIKTILSGLMSGGFETVFSTAIIMIGFLSTPGGQSTQQKAYEDIMSHYDTAEQAFELCVSEEKSAYVCALVKEALRFYPPLKLLPARQTYKEFDYRGTTIPKGVLIYMNAQAINRDKATYGPDASQFRPERWMEKDYDVPPPYHFAFGAGARMCTAVNFSNRLLYAIFLRLIVSFKMTASKSMPPDIHYINYKRSPAESNAIASDFKVRFMPRNQEALERCFEQSQKKCAPLMSGDSVEAFKR